MIHRLVLTAGTSAFAPNNAGKWARETDVFDWPGRDPVVRDERTFERWAKVLKAFAPADLHTVSAEISTLNALVKLGRLSPSPEVVVIHTQTIAGQAAALLVEAVATRRFKARVTLKAVDALDTDSPTRMRSALGQFMSVVASALDGHDPRSTCFAPLGGYKVMTSLGYLAGAYLGFPTAYLHEGRQVLHTVPAIPVALSPHRLKEVAPLVRKVGQLISVAALSPHELRLSEAHSYFFERDGDHIGLSAYAFFLRERPELRGRLGTQVKVPSEIQRRIQGQEQWVAGQIDTLLAWRTLVDRRARTHHEVDFGHSGAPFHLFKGASNGVVVFRAAWRYHEASDCLELNEIWLDHDAYEREAANGQALLTASTEWVDLTEQLYPLKEA